MEGFSISYLEWLHGIESFMPNWGFSRDDPPDKQAPHAILPYVAELGQSVLLLRQCIHRQGGHRNGEVEDTSRLDV